MSKDYYGLLGVDKRSSQDDIKKAYRKLAMQYHPDRNKDDASAEAKFKEINEAYEVLKDEQKRSNYDRFGDAAGGGSSGFGGGQSGFSGFSKSSGFGGFSFFEDLFSDFSGGGRGQSSTKSSGDDLQHEAAITLEEAFHGKQIQIKYGTFVSCVDCTGSGAEKGSTVKKCGVCNGMGSTHQQQGFFTVERTCNSCNGEGEKIDSPCKGCTGSGRKRETKTLSINIPAGIEHGTQLRISGEGEAGFRKGRNGDLYLLIKIKQHELFERQEDDIHCQVPINMVCAALGGEIEVPTIDGTTAKINIAHGTQNGQTLRLKSKGMSKMKSKICGDMYVHLLVETPVHLTKKQKDILESFREATKDNDKTNPKTEGFFKKVCSFFKKDE
jgi:molecular chaperone DnaJ